MAVGMIEALVGSHGLDGCMGASDWPHLRAPERMDDGPLLRMAGFGGEPLGPRR